MVATLKTSSRWLSLLGAAVIGVSAFSTSTSQGCIPEIYADGYCDLSNNSAECGFDSGDCCSCTCVDTNLYNCGEYDGFACIDPDAPCVDDDDVTIEKFESCGYLDGIGNGYCDTDNNKAICDYDGGDCCSCTCSTENNEYDDDYGCRGGFQCIDPAAECVDDDDITIDLVENCGYVGGIGNGYCDEENNNAGCNFDGGDCCKCTCVAQPRTDDWTGDDFYGGCGGGFACIDPDSGCADDDDITIGLVEECDTVSMADAYCDENNNRPECNYDGGDCCSCDCQDTPNQKCGQYGGFACIDPNSLCVNDDDITVDMLEECDYVGAIEISRFDFNCSTRLLVRTLPRNGYCDEGNNKPECNYDGGDCCSCTCSTPPSTGDDDYSYYCQDFACIDPGAQCVDDDDITVNMLDACEWVTGIGNGYCDLDMNTPECNYDGGDCCECTCEVSENADDYFLDGRYAGCNDFACIDPDATCVDADLITIEMIDNCDYVLGIGNGYCNTGNNNELCLFDGGDCCSCTCEYSYDDDYACSAGGAGFDCKDESASCFGEEKTIDDDDYSTDDYAMSYAFVPWVQDGPLPTVEGAVEVGTKTEVGVTAVAYDVRPGASAVDVGCGPEGGEGCAPANSRDGIASEIESRWSCAPKLVIGEAPCQIEYTFAEPQDIVDIQVAFWKGNERTRTLQVHLDGVPTHTHDSYAGSTFNTLSVSGSGVTTVMLESVELLQDEWLSLIEVLIFVTP